MLIRSLTHLTDGAVIEGFSVLLADERTNTAELLVYLAEIDARRLYVSAGYPSMFAYCVGHFHLSEEAAYKRIRSARAAREFPALLDAIADGRLHLTAVVILAAHLRTETVDDLISAATHKSRSEIERLLACRFPRPDLPTRVTQLVSATPGAPTIARAEPERIGLESQVVDQLSPGL